jgi:peptidoglycan/LPS O-acetylase OafA/YrhL
VSPPLERLRPHPHRGDVIAAGAVPLALSALIIELRMTQWSLGPRFAIVLLVAALLLTMAWLAPLEFDGPRSYHTVLLVSGLLTLLPALLLLAEVLGSSRPPGSGGLAWTLAAEAVVAGTLARRTSSGVCTLIAALAGAIALEAFVAWVFKPHGLGTFRAILVALTIALIGGVIRLRDHRRRHAVALVNAAGLLTLVLAGSFLLTALLTTSTSVPGSPTGRLLAGAAGVAFGWKLYLLAIGFGLVAYAGADREPGPAYIGTAVLVAFAVLAGAPAINRGSLVGWPLLLLALGVAGLVIGLRPREPLPPEPATGTAPTVSLDPKDT